MNFSELGLTFYEVAYTQPGICNRQAGYHIQGIMIRIG